MTRGNGKILLIFGVLAGVLGLGILWASLAGTEVYYMINSLIIFWPLIITGWGIYNLIKKKFNKINNFIIIGFSILLLLANIYIDLLRSALMGLALVLISFAAYVASRYFKQNQQEEIEELKRQELSYDIGRNPERWKEISSKQAWDFSGDELKEDALGQGQEKLYDKEPETIEATKAKPKEVNSSNKSKPRVKLTRGKSSNKLSNKRPSHVFSSASSYELVDSNSVNGDYVFSSSRKIVETDEFVGGEVATVFSDVWLDLSRAVPMQEEIRMDADVVFSSLNIRMPKNTKAHVKGANVFGSTKIKGKAPKDPAYNIYLNNDVIFGSLNIEYKDEN